MTDTIKVFNSADQGAPVVSNNWGDLVGMLDACLVNGYNLKTIDSITLSGTTATATISAGHLYTVGQVLLVAGANQGAYNGEIRPTAVTNNTVSWTVAGSPASPATTSTALSIKVAPLGFDIAFTGTNKRVYRSANVLSNRPYLRVDNSLDPVYATTYCKFAKVTMAESMSDVDTFAGARAPYDPNNPTKNEVGTGSGASSYVGWHKWFYAGNGSSDHGVGPRNWVLIGDDRGFFFAINPGTGGSWGPVNNRCFYSFTDFGSYKAGDAYNTVLTATDFYNTSSTGRTNPWDNTDLEASNNFTGKVLMRDYTQLGNPVRVGLLGLNLSNAAQVSGRSNSVPFPNGPDFGVLLHPMYLRQENGHMRGTMPGVYQVCQAQPYPDLTLLENVTGYPGRKFLMVSGYHNGSTDYSMLAFDVTGPWVR